MQYFFIEIVDISEKQRYNIKCIALKGLTAVVRLSERKRLVRAFRCQAGAYPELLRETAAYFCVKDT